MKMLSEQTDVNVEQGQKANVQKLRSAEASRKKANIKFRPCIDGNSTRRDCAKLDL